MAFTSTRDRNWHIYVLNADGSDQKRLTNNTSCDKIKKLGNWFSKVNDIIFAGSNATYNAIDEGINLILEGNRYNVRIKMPRPISDIHSSGRQGDKSRTDIRNSDDPQNNRKK